MITSRLELKLKRDRCDTNGIWQTLKIDCNILLWKGRQESSTHSYRQQINVLSVSNCSDYLTCTDENKHMNRCVIFISMIQYDLQCEYYQQNRFDLIGFDAINFSLCRQWKNNHQKDLNAISLRLKTILNNFMHICSRFSCKKHTVRYSL